MEVNTKEVEIVRTQASKAIALVGGLVVKDDASMLEAGEVRKKIKLVAKMVKDKKESITKPINDALKQVRSLFAPIETSCEEAESIVSRKMLDYQAVVESEKQKAEAEALKKLQEAQKKLEEGKITEKQVEKIEQRIETTLEKVAEPIKSSQDFHTREIQKFRIVNELDIPREYLVPDEVKIRKAMMAGVLVKGVEYYKERLLV